MAQALGDFEKSFSVAGRTLGDGHPCFIIAEAGVSHFGDIRKAFALVDMAVHARADAVKFQIFKTSELISHSNAEWIERMRPKELSVEAFVEIQQYCRDRGIIFFATAHDLQSLETLARLDPPVYKIGSGEVNNPEFFQAVARLSKPVIFSTGMYSREDFLESLDAVRGGGCRQVAVLHCVTRYPVPPAEVNLRRILTLKEIFPGPVGYSDHCATYDIAASAVMLGVDLIEKHITLERNIPNAQDWKVSCDANELVELVASIRRLEKARGDGSFTRGRGEFESLTWARKSVVATKDLPVGTVLSREMLAFKRPGTGMSPNKIPGLIGRKLKAKVKTDSIITEDLLE